MAVLYSFLLLFMIGLTALVIDLGAMRADRRSTQLTSDVSAIAGAMDMVADINSGTPLRACRTALEYVAENLNLTVSGDPCSTKFSDSMPCDLLAENTLTTTLDDYVVRITWPVPDTSELMYRGGSPALNPGIDGLACERLAVQVARNRGFIFGGIYGGSSVFVGAPAVARGWADGDEGEAVSLVILDPIGCDALLASGRAKVWVKEAERQAGDADGNPIFDPDGNPVMEKLPGIISVDSDGSLTTPGPRRCIGGSGGFTMDASGVMNSEIKAGVIDNAGNVGPNGLILSHAVKVGNVATAYDPTDLATGRLSPQPRAGGPATRERVDDRYLDAINDLISEIGAAGRPDATYQEFPADVPGAICNLPSSALPIGPLTGNWWVNCPGGLNMATNITFEGGNVVFQGGVRVQGSARLSINDTASATARFVYLRSGNFVKDAQSAIVLNEATVYLASGVISFGAGSGGLTWIAPFDGDLDDLALWSESSAQHVLGGQTLLNIEGVFFTPNADPFNFDGQAGQVQTKAQFITHRLELSGQGTLLMAPDPERQVLFPVLAVRLIR